MVKNSAGYWTHPTQESVLAACMDHSPDFGGFGLPGAGDSWESFSLVNEGGASLPPARCVVRVVRVVCRVMC